ncbi:MAG: Autotransporter adhesin [Myxococcaceae bacterium]|nr:Autotransporter adhesin [Myxococcaceae bacterium]
MRRGACLQTRARKTAWIAAAALLAVASLTAASACSLLTSLDGLSSGEPTDAATDTSPTPPVDAGGDAPSGMNDSGGDVDAADAAPSRSALYASAVLADNPLGYWRLEETAGMTAKDETGRNDGAYVNTPLLAQPGVAGSAAAKLPATLKSRIAVATGNFGFTGNAQYTVELWVKPGTFRDYQWLSGTELEVPNRRGWSLLADANGAIRYETWTSDGDGGSLQTRGLFVSGASLVQDTFAHIVLAYTGSVALGYVDGVNTTMFNTVGMTPPGGPLLWGCRGDLQQCLDDWVIDELAIYDFPLSQARVKAHYDLGK